MKPSALGGVSILSGTLFVPWSGAWVLDVDLDLASSAALPSGKVTPNVGDTTLTGTIDARGTARFGEKARARVVAGAGGWSTTPPARHFHSDAGLQSSTIVQATAQEVGETVVDGAPVDFGVDYVRLAGPASRVLAGRDWYVDAAGVTQIASWPASTPPDDVQVHEYDPETRRLLLSSDSIVWPGTVFSSSTFGTVIARDVEVAIAPSSFRVTVWCAAALSSRRVAAVREQTREFAEVDFGKTVRYRIRKVGVDGRLTLEATDPTDGFPPTLDPISVWPGMAGYFADFVAGTEVIVELRGRDPKNPIVRGFAPPDITKTSRVALAPPTQANFDALVAFAAACGNAVNPQVSEIKTAAIALYNALTGLALPAPPPAPPYAPSKSVQAEVGRAQ